MLNCFFGLSARVREKITIHLGYYIYIYACGDLCVTRNKILYHLISIVKPTSSGTAVCLLASRQQYLFDKCLLLYVQS